MSRRLRNRRRQALGLIAVVAVAVALVIGKDSPGTFNRKTPLVRSLSDGRSGRFAFRSYSLDRDDVVRGRLVRRPVAITAQLDLPATTAGSPRLPAAILMHGSDGLSNLQSRYARELRAGGIATLVIDSFSGRGIQSTVGQQGSLAADAMVVDAYAALRLLSSHPRIDPGSIALIGWSKGGWRPCGVPGNRFAAVWRRAANASPHMWPSIPGVASGRPISVSPALRC